MSKNIIDHEIIEVCKKCGKNDEYVIKIVDGEQYEYQDIGTTEECWKCACKRIKKEAKLKAKENRKKAKDFISNFFKNGTTK